MEHKNNPTPGQVRLKMQHRGSKYDHDINSRSRIAANLLRATGINIPGYRFSLRSKDAEFSAYREVL